MIRGFFLLLSLLPARTMGLRGVTRICSPRKAPVVQHAHQKSIAKQIGSCVFPTFLALTVAVVTPANAVDGASVFNHDYADPLHPLCDRKIRVARDGKTFHYSGTTVGPQRTNGDPSLLGCTSEEIKQYGPIRKEEFDGQIIVDNRIKTGDYEGVWEAGSSTSTLQYEDMDGIRWNGNNKWIVKSQVQVIKDENGKYIIRKKPFSVIVGEIIFYAYIGFSTLAGFKGALNAFEKKKQQEEA